MRRLLLVLVPLLAATVTLADDMPGMSAPSTSATPPPLMGGLGGVHHPVTTRSAEAQGFFDQGLALCYAFNHDEAIRAFRHAAGLDPALAMAHWGVALALGPNINLPMDAGRESLAVDEIAKARAIATGASGAEREYIEALATRYATPAGAMRAERDTAYRDAMRALASRHPDDPDAGVLFAESAMDLRPWMYWSAQGKAAPGTDEIVTTLEGVLKRFPNHTGANHLMIHALEASPHPEQASAAAMRLRELAPAAGHLVHMPTHIGARLGDWIDAGERNDRAAAVDERYVAEQAPEGVYPVMYLNHNLQFAAYGWTTAGAYERAMVDARKVTANGEAVVKDIPMVELVTNTVLVVQTRFRRWDEVKAIPEPPAWMPATRGSWDWAQGMRLASTGDAAGARAHLDSLRARAARFTDDYLIGLNPAGQVLSVAAAQLEARITEAEHGASAAVPMWRSAVTLEDALGYDEPPDWYAFSGESLGGALLRAGDARGAIEAFRAELARHPHSPRALFGLARALEAAGRKSEAASTDAEFRKQARMADVTFSVPGL